MTATEAALKDAEDEGAKGAELANEISKVTEAGAETPPEARVRPGSIRDVGCSEAAASGKVGRQS